MLSESEGTSKVLHQECFAAAVRDHRKRRAAVVQRVVRVRDENRARRVHGTCKDGMMRSIRRCKQRASVTRGRQRARMRLTSLLEPCVKGLSTCREDLLVREGAPF